MTDTETARLRAALARIRQMTDYWEQHLPEVIRTPAVVSALRAAMELAAVEPPADQAPPSQRAALRDRIAQQEQQATAKAKAALAPLEAKARKLRERMHAEHRAAVLREAADFVRGLLLTRTSITTAELEAELRRMADETTATVSPAATVRPGDRAAAAQPESCAHCGQPISRITGTLAAWWVHDPGGNTVCHPGQAASSPRATPTAAGARQDGAPADDPLCICMHPRSRHPKISGRLLCDECDPDSTDNLTCEEFDAL